jgi:hypothetical protein
VPWWVYPESGMSRPHSYSNTKNRLHDLHDRIQRGQAASEDLLTPVSCVEELVADLEKPRQEVARLLRGLRNQQRILNTHVAAIEDSLIFRFLRRLGGPLLEWKARFEQLGRDSALANCGRAKWIASTSVGCLGERPKCRQPHGPAAGGRIQGPARLQYFDGRHQSRARGPGASRPLDSGSDV